MPLWAILAEVTGAGVASKGVTATHHRLLGDLGNELSILITVPLPDIEAAAGRLLATAIQSMRAGKANVAPGYGGEYGTVRLLHAAGREDQSSQTSPF